MAVFGGIQHWVGFAICVVGKIILSGWCAAFICTGHLMGVVNSDGSVVEDVGKIYLPENIHTIYVIN